MTIKEVTVPDLGGATDVVVIEILVKKGDEIAVDTPIVTLESDKATMEVPTKIAGIVKDIRVKVGDKIENEATLLTIDTKETQKQAEVKKEIKETNPIAHSQEESGKEKNTQITADKLPQTEVHAGPSVRRLARELELNLASIVGTGPKNRILKEDVKAYVKQAMNHGGNPAPSLSLPMIDFAKFGPVEKKPLSRVKKISGNNLQRNWSLIPHVTQFGEADITELEHFRQAQKETLDKQQIKLTPLVFIMKAVVAALKAFPHFNASLDANSDYLTLKNYFHIGVAVDTPEGLVVPVIRNVDQQGLVELAKTLALMSQKARNKQLTPGDMQGGCFSISSLGGIGGTAFTPIINYPEVAILGVSKSAYKPVYQDGQFVPRLMLPLSVSYDHRVIDGAEGARFILYLTQMLADIRNLLL